MVDRQFLATFVNSGISRLKSMPWCCLANFGAFNVLIAYMHRLFYDYLNKVTVLPWFEIEHVGGIDIITKNTTPFMIPTLTS